MPEYFELKATIAFNQGSSDVSKDFRFDWKYDVAEGMRSDRSVAMAKATIGIVSGLYQRCGFGVLLGSPSRV